MSLRQRRPHARPRSEQAAPDVAQRLQKVLAAAGLGSRRHCEELILAGRVEVDGQVVSALGAKADPHNQRIRVDGVALAQPRREYFIVHKPPGVLSTSRDPSGRPRVIDLVPSSERLFTVGRLDMSSEGLILVTNDGELANRLSHPRYGVEKTYHVEVAGTIERDELHRLRKGAHLAEGFARVISARIKHSYKQSTQLEIVLGEGRNREIRRILARAGHKVLRLKRVALGPLRLGELPPAAVRPLTRDELRQLQAAAGQIAHRAKRPRPKPAARPLPKVAAKKRTVIGGGLAKRDHSGTGKGRKKTTTRRRPTPAAKPT